MGSNSRSESSTSMRTTRNHITGSWITVISARNARRPHNCGFRDVKRDRGRRAITNPAGEAINVGSERVTRDAIASDGNSERCSRTGFAAFVCRPAFLRRLAHLLSGSGTQCAFLRRCGRWFPCGCLQGRISLPLRGGHARPHFWATFTPFLSRRRRYRCSSGWHG
jgi:hypothetical protein